MSRTIRIAAVADLHCSLSQEHQESFEPLFATMARQADIVLLCGDLTEHGLPEEGARLIEQMRPVDVPMVAVLGNHDYESGGQDELTRILCARGVRVLDGQTCEVHGIGFAGAKGFAGGFGRRALAPWGEPAIKEFVRAGWEETQKLDAALARLTTAVRFAVLHYAPIPGTVEGEPLEIYPFLGSSHLEGPINKHAVRAVLHGHSHHGSPEGATDTGIPVYNVALPVLRASMGTQPPVRWLEVDVESDADQGERNAGA
jgi:Icc-related predicted phosphoesterase